MPCIEIGEDEFAHSDIAAGLKPDEFLRTQREKFEAARLRVMTNTRGKEGVRKNMRKLDRKALRAKMKRKLVRRRKKQQMKEFFAEVRARADEGYSKRQLLSSLIPSIGTEVKVADAEVTAALQGRQVVF